MYRHISTPVYTFPLVCFFCIKPRACYKTSFASKKFDTLQDGITELNQLSNKMPCLEIHKPRKPTLGQQHPKTMGMRLLPRFPCTSLSFVLKQWGLPIEVQICNDRSPSPPSGADRIVAAKPVRTSEGQEGGDETFQSLAKRRETKPGNENAPNHSLCLAPAETLAMLTQSFRLEPRPTVPFICQTHRKSQRGSNFYVM